MEPCREREGVGGREGGREREREGEREGGRERESKGHFILWKSYTHKDFLHIQGWISQH